jgi:hypothetical protein
MPLDLAPSRPIFACEDLNRYWPLGVQQDHLAIVDEPAQQCRANLFKLIRKFLPHLRESFVCSPEWWTRNWGTPESHVRYLNQALISEFYTDTLSDVHARPV